MYIGSYSDYLATVEKEKAELANQKNAERKEKAAVDLWMKEIGPSTELRKWFGHKPERWDEFRTRYREELKGKRGLLDELRAHAATGRLTLVYSARDEAHNQAVVIREVLG